MCDTARTSDENLLSETQKQHLNTLGDTDCNGSIGMQDLVNMIDEYLDIGRYSMQVLVDYIDIYLNEKNTRDDLLLSIKNGTYIPASCTINGCTDSQQSQSTSQRAEAKLSGDDSTLLRIANIPRNDNSGNYDIFFKGKEVLEYIASLDTTSPLLNNNQIHDVFKNLFNNDQYNSHIITDNQLYHARKEGDWNPNTLYKIFENCNFKIESINSIRYHDTNNDTIRVEKLENGSSVDVRS